MSRTYGLVGTVIGLAVAIVGSIGLLAGYVPRIWSGFIAIAAIGIIVASRRAVRAGARD